MRAFGRAVGASVIAFVCSACGGSGGHHGSGSDAGGDSGSSGSSNGAGGSNGAGAGGVAHGGQNNAGTASTAGSSPGGNSAVGGSGSSGSGGVVIITEPGTVTDDWDGFCVATLSADYVAKDAFGKDIFTAKAGEKYLLLDYPPMFGAKAAYLTSTGLLEFEIEPTDGNAAYPFTSNCQPGYPLGVSYFAAFADVTVYAEEQLTSQVCELKAGDHVVRDESIGAGYGLVKPGATSNVYEIFLNAFSAQCGNLENGFVAVPTINLFGTNRVLVPFHVIDAEE